jgi:hypothetical protein
MTRRYWVRSSPDPQVSQPATIAGWKVIRHHPAREWRIWYNSLATFKKFNIRKAREQTLRKLSGNWLGYDNLKDKI